MGTPAVFLDRDGVINHRRLTLVRHPGLLTIKDGVPEAIARLSQAGYTIVVVTNQRPVAWGLIDPHNLDSIHRKIRETVEDAGGRIDQFQACTHGFFTDCACGKPEPGMLEEAAQALNIDPETSWMIGDKTSDIQAGKRFGAHTAWITGSRYPWDYLKPKPEADLVAETLPEAVDQILAQPTPNAHDPAA